MSSTTGFYFFTSFYVVYVDFFAFICCNLSSFCIYVASFDHSVSLWGWFACFYGVHLAAFCFLCFIVAVFIVILQYLYGMWLFFHHLAIVLSLYCCFKYACSLLKLFFITFPSRNVINPFKLGLWSCLGPWVRALLASSDTHPCFQLQSNTSIHLAWVKQIYVRTIPLSSVFGLHDFVPRAIFTLKLLFNHMEYPKPVQRSSVTVLCTFKKIAVNTERRSMTPRCRQSQISNISLHWMPSQTQHRQDKQNRADCSKQAANGLPKPRITAKEEDIQPLTTYQEFSVSDDSYQNITRNDEWIIFYL